MTIHNLTEEDRKRDENNFIYHAPHSDQTHRYEAIRAHLGSTASWLRTLCPPSRELSLAITKLEEAMFWANASIARNEAAPK